MVCIFPAES
uniref:Uncharacterized protein n=1 Tax=Anguilla anguilla TaxID=7936 RepID=A0A0E9QSZ1_ANGAN